MYARERRQSEFLFFSHARACRHVPCTLIESILFSAREAMRAERAARRRAGRDEEYVFKP